MSLERLVSWLIDDALPVWAERGYDPANRRFRERLDRNGNPLAVPHRAMVQARQIYVFCQAAELGWFKGGVELATEAGRTLEQSFADGEQTHCAFRFAIDDTDRLIATQKEAYTQAFILFALAWLHRATGDAGHLERADGVLNFIERNLIDPQYGGLFDDFPRTTSSKRQNPHMHMVEALLALDETAPHRGYAAQAQRFCRIVGDHMIDQQRGLLPEYFDEDWSITTSKGVAEPGHHFEWMWLLAELNQRSSGPMHHWGMMLDRTATAHGFAKNGLIFDEIGIDLSPTKRSHRLWPHCEAIKAAAVRHCAGDTAARAFADRIAASMLDVFLGRPFLGGWIDHVTPELQPMLDYVPASSLYHLTLAIAVAAGTFGLADVRRTTATMAAQ